jgi:hypothetical protein
VGESEVWQWVGLVDNVEIEASESVSWHRSMIDHQSEDTYVSINDVYTSQLLASHATLCVLAVVRESSYANIE